MKIQYILLFIFFLGSSSVVRAQSNFGAEIVSYQTFGEGMMVTKAKMAPISGTVSNIFFYNRADEPWNGNVWYEYDWELRGAHPMNGWSQVRVRENSDVPLRDAPVDVDMSENIGNKFFHYILIRKDNQYIYDVREDFDIDSYDYTEALAHGGNSVSIIVGGPRVYVTGDNVANIPQAQRLDFSLGITAFDNSWAGLLPNESYSGDYVIDFTRFYEFSGNELNTTPQWQDEFNQNHLDYSKWFAATWSFRATQFTTDNLIFENGYLIMRVNRGGESNLVGATNLATLGQASQSSIAQGGDASRAIDDNRSGAYSSNSVTLTDSESNAWWQVDLRQLSDINQIVIYGRSDSCCIALLSDFSVSVLDEDDNVVWTQFYSQSSNSPLVIDLDTVGKKVRINLNGTLSLAEVEVYGSEANIEVIDLSTTQSFGLNQDFPDTGPVEILGDGALRLKGNRWQKVYAPVTITPTTELHFEFKSDTQGEIHGIGVVDNSNRVSSNRTFALWGTQNWGHRTNYGYSGDGTFQSYIIPIGEVLNGYYPYLTFVMDDDANGLGESVFKNVRFVDNSEEPD